MALAPAAFTARARRVRLLLFDVDGVLTDCSVTISDSAETKTFSVRDGAALQWAKQSGLEVGFLSARPSDATTRRAKELGIDLVVQSPAPKRESFKTLLTTKKLSPEEVAYMGDDLADLGVIAQVGLSAAPADAVPDVTSRVHWVSGHAGGRGAVREFIEAVLRARHQWDAVVSKHLA